jgi:diguanylate cyclase (GGDEF)-like protein/PAS domain S-box-containing protein
MGMATTTDETAPIGPVYAPSDRGAFFDISRDLLCVTGLDGYVKDLNPAWEQVLGYTREQVMARPFVEFLHPEDLPAVMAQVGRVAAQEPTGDFECRIRRADGSYRWFQWSSNRIVRDGLIYAVARDVTDDKHTAESARESRAGFGLLAEAVERHELALRESEARFRAMFESAAVGIALAGMDGRLIEANPALEALLGQDPDALRGRTLAEFADPDDPVSDRDLFQDMVEGNRVSYRVDRRFLRTDGSVLPARQTVSLVRGGNGTPHFAVSMVEDMSLALIDELTGLANRRAFLAFGQRQLHLASREHRTPAVLFMDLDGLKRINDTFGHGEGDRALVEVARILARTFRAADMASRYGGDEFCVLLFEGAHALSAAQRFGQGIEAWSATGDEPYELSMSMGAARFDWQSPATMEELVAEADRAMYQAKSRTT